MLPNSHILDQVKGTHSDAHTQHRHTHTPRVRTHTHTHTHHVCAHTHTHTHTDEFIALPPSSSQYRNASNPLAHYDLTAEEILEQCEGTYV